MWSWNLSHFLEFKVSEDLVRVNKEWSKGQKMRGLKYVGEKNSHKQTSAVRGEKTQAWLFKIKANANTMA